MDPAPPQSLQEAQASGLPLLPEGLIDNLASEELLQYGLLSQSGCPAVQHLAGDPAPKRVLLDKLFTSLAVLQGAKAAAGSGLASGRPSPDPSDGGGSQSPFDVALLEQLSQLDVGVDSSPTGPLSREESIASLASSSTHAASTSPHRQLTTSLPFTNNLLPPRQVPQPAPAQAAVATVAAGLAHQQAPRASCTTALSALNAQLLGTLPTNMHPNAVLPSPQLQQYTPSAYPLLMPVAAAPVHAIQYIQQQLLWQQLQQAQAALLQAQTQALEDECLVGPAGQYQVYCTQIISREVNAMAQCLLAKLKMLQQADPAQGLWSKRYFCSIKEVSNVVHRAKCIIVAPDVKPNRAAHINPVKMLVQVLRCAELHNVPIVFALSRRGIGQVFGRDKSMSIVAVMYHEQCQAEFGALLQLSQQGRAAFLIQHGGMRRHGM